MYIFVYINQFPWDSPWGKKTTRWCLRWFFSFLWDWELPYFQPLVGNLVGKFLGLENWFLWWGGYKVFKMGNHGTSKVMSREFCWFVCFTCTSSNFWDLWITWCKWSTFLRLLMLSSTSGTFGKITLKFISNFLLYCIHVFLLSWTEQIVVWCCVMGGLGSYRGICSKWDSKHCQILVDFLN